MTVSISETQGTDYTWADAGFAWVSLEGGKSWDAASTSLFTASTAESLALAPGSGRAVTLPISRALGLAPARKAETLREHGEAFNAAAINASVTEFLSAAAEALALDASDARTSVLPASEVLALTSAAARQATRELTEVVALADTSASVTLFVRELLEAFANEDAPARVMIKPAVSQLGVADIVFRHANAIFADLAIRSTPLDEAGFRQLIAERRPLGYGPFRELTPGDYDYASALIALSLSAPATGQQIAITSATLHADVPDIRDRGADSVPAGGITIPFHRTFTEPPEVQVTMKAGAAPALPEITAIATTGFSLRLIDAADGQSPVAGTVSWSALGY